ncbi:MAG: cell division protein FtsA, partial [Pyramidobacter sp.]|nr:cell division protein FtsA [Pyramidobacter sp.]
MGRDSDILVGLDLGTKKIAVAVAERAPENPDKAQIIGIGQAPSRGLRKG